MRIEVTGKHMELTPPMTEYAETKCAKLPRYFNGVQEIDVLLEKAAHSEEFEVELRVDVVKHETFVARVTGRDIYQCIDLCVDKMSRQLKDFKEKLKDNRG